MEFKLSTAELFVPDGLSPDKALARTTQATFRQTNASQDRVTCWARTNDHGPHAVA